MISAQEYLASERISEVKHELIDGQAYAMAAYTNMPTLQEYVLIEQDFVNIEVLRKSSDWQGRHYVLGIKFILNPST